MDRFYAASQRQVREDCLMFRQTLLSALLCVLVSALPLVAQTPCDPDDLVPLQVVPGNELIMMIWEPAPALSTTLNIVEDGVVIASVPSDWIAWSGPPTSSGLHTYWIEDPACGVWSTSDVGFSLVDVGFSCSSPSAPPGGSFEAVVSFSSSVPVQGGVVGVAVGVAGESLSVSPTVELLATAPQYLVMHADPTGTLDGWVIAWIDALNPLMATAIPPTTDFPIATITGGVSSGAPLGSTIPLEITGVYGQTMLGMAPGVFGLSPENDVVGITPTIPTIDGTVFVGGASFRRGDANGSGGVGIDDVIFLLEWMMDLGPEPGCIAAADVLGDGQDPILAEALTLLMAIHDPNAPDPIAGCHVHPLEGLTCDAPGGCP